VEWTDSGLVPGTSYVYRAAASGPAGRSTWGVWARGATVGTTLAAPTGLTATVAGTGRVDLIWTDNSVGETGFRVERARDPLFSLDPTATEVTGTTFSDSPPAALTGYWYRVFARDASSLSSPSNTAWAAIPAAPPEAPSGLRAVAVRRRLVTVAWIDRSGDEEGFVLERSANGLTFTAIAQLPANTVSHTDSGLFRRRRYWYRLRAFNAAGSSPWSNVIGVRTR
jgi:chitodextrinase